MRGFSFLSENDEEERVFETRGPFGEDQGSRSEFFRCFFCGEEIRD